MFTRLLYLGTVHLNLTEQQIWLTPIGHLLDLWECHRQHLGWVQPKRNLGIDQIIPDGI